MMYIGRVAWDVRRELADGPTIGKRGIHIDQDKFLISASQLNHPLTTILNKTAGQPTEQSSRRQRPNLWLAS
jgi:hypothetical protein